MAGRYLACDDPGRKSFALFVCSVSSMPEPTDEQLKLIWSRGLSISIFLFSRTNNKFEFFHQPHTYSDPLQNDL